MILLPPMHASSRIPHFNKGHCCCSNQTLAVLLDSSSSVTHTPHPILQPFLQNTARTQDFSPLLCHCSDRACHLAPGRLRVPHSAGPRLLLSPLERFSMEGILRSLIRSRHAPIQNQLSFTSQLEQNPKSTPGSTRLPRTLATTTSPKHSAPATLAASTLPRRVGLCIPAPSAGRLPPKFPASPQQMLRSSPTTWSEAAPHRSVCESRQFFTAPPDEML